MATFGIIVAPVFISGLTMIPRILREDLAISLAAQFQTLPVIVYNFSRMFLIGIVVNSLMLWVIPIFIISGFVTLALGLVIPSLGKVIGLLPGILLTYYINLVDIFADIPGAGIRIEQISVVLWLGYYPFVGAFIWAISLKKEEVKPLTSSGNRF